MANIRLHDVIPSVEKWLIDNWPDAQVAFIPTAADTRRPNTGARADTHAALQWISYTPAQPMRPDEDWNAFDVRIVVQASENDRLRAEKIADDLRDLIRSTVIEVVDRADGTTLRGYVRFTEVGITPPQKDSRGVVVAVVDVQGWAHSA